jgi:hypothetical protein
MRLAQQHGVESKIGSSTNVDALVQATMSQIGHLANSIQ